MEALSTNLPVVSNVLTAASGIARGTAEKRAADFRAAQLDQQAGQSQAAAQREAIEQRRRARLVNSALQARAGGSAGDVGVIDLAADIAGEGEYRALTSLFEGDEHAAGLRMQASATRLDGKTKQRSAMLGALPSIFSGGSTLYDKYGKADPFEDFYKRGTRGSGD